MGANATKIWTEVHSFGTLADQLRDAPLPHHATPCCGRAMTATTHPHPDPINQAHEADCELVIGLVGATGTDLNRVSELLKKQLMRTGYAVEILKVSEEVIPEFGEVVFNPANPYDRISKLMTAGNQAREVAKDDSVLALGAAARIAARRIPTDANPSPQPRLRHAVIVNSLKRPEEVERFRQIYRNGFVLIGVYAGIPYRREALVEQGMTPEQAEDLIARDADERQELHGQRLNKTFYLADFFIRLDQGDEKTRSELNRIVELLFGHPNRTPTIDEYSMFFAFTAALRSADLSRQVGAVIARNGVILSTGANDCPRATGGLYWPIEDDHGRTIDEPCGRDYLRGVDSNAAEQTKIVEALVELGAKRGLDEATLRSVLHSPPSPIGDLTEYGRVVHAEMDALTSCSRTGVSAAGATLYCTTFPCHNCAKHIIAAGINRVVFIEPYPKSKALDFHPDAIVFDSRGEGDRKVLFEPFFGVGPRRFFDLFSMNLSNGYDVARKDQDTGHAKAWDHKSSRLRLQMLPSSYLELEKQAASMFEGKLQSGGTSNGPAPTDSSST